MEVIVADWASGIGVGWLWLISESLNPNISYLIVLYIYYSSSSVISLILSVSSGKMLKILFLISDKLSVLFINSLS